MGIGFAVGIGKYVWEMGYWRRGGVAYGDDVKSATQYFLRSAQSEHHLSTISEHFFTFGVNLSTHI